MTLLRVRRAAPNGRMFSRLFAMVKSRRQRFRVRCQVFESAVSDTLGQHQKRSVAVSNLTWQEFERVDLRVGTVMKAEPFPEARKPAVKLTIDFGDVIGVRKSSARITDHYTPNDLLGKQVVGVINFPPKQIGPFMSECLVTGFVQDDGSVILAVPDKPAANGSRLA